MSRKAKISGYRRMMGLTQKDMAAIFGVAPSTYFLKEKGEVGFSDEEKIKFRDKLRDIFPGITIDDIFFSD